MTVLLARRLLVGAAVLAGVITLTFVLLHLAPGDPVERLVGPDATAEQLAAQRRALGLDRPLPAQFATWLARAARADWGPSLATGRPVGAEVSVHSNFLVPSNDSSSARANRPIAKLLGFSLFLRLPGQYKERIRGNQAGESGYG